MNYRVSRNGEGFAILGPSSETLVKANEFLRAIELRNLSRHTIRAYSWDLLACFRWLDAAGHPFGDLTSALLLDFIAFQKERGASPRSINRRLNTVQLFYRFATGNELPRGAGSMFPAPHFKGRGRDRELGLHTIGTAGHRRLKIKTPRTLVEPLSKDQVILLLKKFTRYRDVAILYLMLLCGLRSQETLSLTCRDVSWLEQRLHVRGKGNKERVLPLPATAATAIQRYVSFERPSDCRTAALFVVLQGRNRGEPMTPAGLRSLFRRRRAHAALRNANPHRLRHTYGSAMAREGVTLPVLQRLMGHADGTTTLQYINLAMTDIAEEFARCVERIATGYRR